MKILGRDLVVMTTSSTSWKLLAKTLRHRHLRQTMAGHALFAGARPGLKFLKQHGGGPWRGNTSCW